MDDVLAHIDQPVEETIQRLRMFCQRSSLILDWFQRKVMPCTRRGLVPGRSATGQPASRLDRGWIQQSTL